MLACGWSWGTAVMPSQPLEHPPSTGAISGSTPVPIRNTLVTAESVGNGTEGYWRVAFHPIGRLGFRVAPR